MKFPSLLFLFFLIARPSNAQNNWTLQKEKDGIKISNRHSATSPFNDIRVELDLPGNIDQLGAILQDVNNYGEWSYATKVSKLIAQQGPESLIYYTEINVPWPATNRCFYARFELKKDPVARTILVNAESLPDYKPISKDLVQVTFTKGNWHITTVSKKIIHVDYIFELNPGGSLPAWMLNLFATKGPMESFENLKKKMVGLNK